MYFYILNELNGDVAILDQAEAMVENEQSKKSDQKDFAMYMIS